ncbi:hypothetical protein DIPPA_24992 [Diplonema papillatum]|nr:hypothetical protein DIPPA_24992 [Diplonema papillatum]
MARYAGLDDDVIGSLKDFEASLTKLKTSLQPLCSLDRKTIKKYDPFTRAKIHAAAAYAVVSLHAMSLTTQGEDYRGNDGHPVQLILRRVHEYFEKIQKSLPEAKKMKIEKQTLRVNKEAAQRLIKAQLGSNATAPTAQAAEAGEEEEVEEVEEVEEIEEVEEEAEEQPPAAAPAAVAEPARKKKRTA